MRSLITGCAGFAGSHLAEHLLEKGEEIIALVGIDEDWANIRHIQEHLRIESADLRDEERVLEVVRSTKPQRIYHLAALSSPLESVSNPKLTYQVNFMGTLNLLLAWRRLDMDCRFLFVSSSEVYGVVSAEHLPLREDANPRPVNPYAGSKMAGEILCLQFYQSYGLPIVRVRPFNHTGPRQSSNFVCSSFARQLAEIDQGLRPAKVVAGNLEVKRDFSDVRDIVCGYYLLLEKGQPCEVYQLCSGRAVSMQSILQLLVSMASKPVQIEVDQSHVRTTDSPEVRGDYSKAESAVGWQPRHELQATLGDLKFYWQDRIHSYRG